MDAIKYLKTKLRMCIAYHHKCKDCPLGQNSNGTELNCYLFQEHRPEEAVTAVEKWAAEHPAKTRQSEFLKMFPNAPFDKHGVLNLFVCDVDERYGDGDEYEYDCHGANGDDCDDCRRKYWLEEIE